jgi:hypothetical protein
MGIAVDSLGAEMTEEVGFNLGVEVLTPAELEQAIKTWRGFLEAAAKDSAGNSLATWEVTYLDVSSLHARYAPVAERPELRVSVLNEVRGAATSIEHGNGVLTSGPFVKAARDLLALAKIAPVEMEVLGQEITIGPQAEVEMSEPLKSIGSIEGRVLVISKRRGLSCTLFDDVMNHAIFCRVPLEMEEEVREAFDRRVIIAGTITRHPVTGVASSITDVTQIERLTYSRGDYRNARAIFKDAPGRPPLDELIRKISDAS